MFDREIASRATEFWCWFWKGHEWFMTEDSLRGRACGLCGRGEKRHVGSLRWFRV